MGKTIRSPRYRIEITGKDPLYLGQWGAVNSGKLEKHDVFLTYEVVTGSS